MDLAFFEWCFVIENCMKIMQCTLATLPVAIFKLNFMLCAKLKVKTNRKHKWNCNWFPRGTDQQSIYWKLEQFDWCRWKDKIFSRLLKCKATQFKIFQFKVDFEFIIWYYTHVVLAVDIANKYILWAWEKIWNNQKVSNIGEKLSNRNHMNHVSKRRHCTEREIHHSNSINLNLSKIFLKN